MNMVTDELDMEDIDKEDEEAEEEKWDEPQLLGDPVGHEMGQNSTAAGKNHSIVYAYIPSNAQISINTHPTMMSIQFETDHSHFGSILVTLFTICPYIKFLSLD